MPTTSTRLPLMKIAMVNAQNAGLKTSPICSFRDMERLAQGPATSPRMANTIDAVPIERQLATNTSVCPGGSPVYSATGLAGGRPVPNFWQDSRSHREDADKRHRSSHPSSARRTRMFLVGSGLCLFAVELS